MLYVIGITVVVLKVLVGLGFVIFVHELGHFAVAKLCGVKCEKFYLGFDIGGLKFCKFRYGETEYGIGILPLGGYVKMLGQEDNPAKYREELERAKKEGREPGEGSEAARALFDPRSYLAKSVPQRMAIISAGVIMNLIFAFLMACVAFGIGVDRTPCVLGEIMPGEPAWQADLRPGDEILEIAGKKMTQFRDLQTAISLGSVDQAQGIPILVRRPGVEKPLTITVRPDPSRGVSMIGVGGPKTTRLLDSRSTWRVAEVQPVLPGSPAAQAQPGFKNGDKIVQIDDTPITNYGQINAVLAQKAHQSIKVVVERTPTDASGKPAGEAERVTVSVAPNPMRELGLVMKMGRVKAVQANSPAAEAKLKLGDLILAPQADPMKLPDRWATQAGKTIDLTIEPAGSKEQKTIKTTPRQPTEITYAIDYNSPVVASSLGVGYLVLNEVERVIPGSPADKAGLRAGDVLKSTRFLNPKDAKDGTAAERVDVDPFPFNDSNYNWPLLSRVLQIGPKNLTVELAFAREGKEQTVKMTPMAASDWFNPERGFLFEPLTVASKAQSLGEAVRLGAQETWDDTTTVFRTVGALSTNRVSPRLLGGPVMIFRLAMEKADAGLSTFLIFLTFLSANLAVLNFLPIPVLDGGHFVLLAYEGIRGKPASEGVQTVLAYFGLALILLLMFWVLGLDFGVFARR